MRTDDSLAGDEGSFKEQRPNIALHKAWSSNRIWAIFYCEASCSHPPFTPRTPSVLSGSQSLSISFSHTSRKTSCRPRMTSKRSGATNSINMWPNNVNSIHWIAAWPTWGALKIDDGCIKSIRQSIRSSLCVWLRFAMLCMFINFALITWPIN